ncbi:hypothetical protein M885DRAFT_330716 [Pelagophyceae sp. CCMP2097]|nr:hypothetical protein M885DRAFT_330716 [Pelagophyceae sp. CCMP2097]
MLALDEAVDEAEAEFNTHRSLRSSILRSRRGDSGLQTEVAVARAGYRLQQKAWEAQQRADYLRRQSDFDSAALSEEALKAKDDAERAELLARAELERRNNEGAEDGRHTFGALPDRPRQKPWPLSIGAIVSLRIAVKKVRPQPERASEMSRVGARPRAQHCSSAAVVGGRAEPAS